MDGFLGRNQKKWKNRTVKSCKKCTREFVAKVSKQVYCCQNCKVNDHRGTKSRWEHVMEIINDKEIHKELGITIVKNSNG